MFSVIYDVQYKSSNIYLLTVNTVSNKHLPAAKPYPTNSWINNEFLMRLNEGR